MPYTRPESSPTYVTPSAPTTADADSLEGAGVNRHNSAPVAADKA